MKRILSLILTVAMVFSLVTISVHAQSKAYGYDNLNNEEGELVIGFIGGSITVAGGDSDTGRYSSIVTDWFAENYPNKTVTEVNAGIGGTASDWGKYRVMTDIGAYAPDVVFVEYAVNDAHLAGVNGESVRSNMESIVRALQSLPKEPVIVFLYSAHDDSYAKLGYTSIPQHEAVAEYYGIESINFYDYIKKSDFIWSKNTSGSLTDDGIHPNAYGHEVYGNFIIEKLETENILHKNIYRNGSKFEYTVKNPRDVDFDDVAKSPSWQQTFAGQSDNKSEAYKTSEAGSTLTLSFEADTIGIVPLSGTASWIMDDGEFSGTINANGSPVIFASGLEAGQHTVTVTSTGAFTTAKFVCSDGVVKDGATVSANGDHMAAAVPANVLLNSQNGNAYSINTGSVSMSIYDNDESGKTGSIFKVQPTKDISARYLPSGLTLKKANSESATQGLFKPTGKHEADKTYVVQARVKALSGNPKIAFAFDADWGYAYYDNEYGKEGFALTNEWDWYKATITPEKVGGSANTYEFGLVPTCTTDDAFLFDFSEGMYIAEEIAWDIEVDAPEGNTVPKGGSIGFDASLVNQIGIEGTLPQNFTWAFADASLAEGAGLSLVSNGSGAVVTATEEATSGTYALKATSTDKSWTKTVDVVVGNVSIVPNTKDHVASGDKLTNNIILKATDGNRVADRNWSYGNLVNSTYPNFTYEEKSHSPAGDGYYGKAGPSWFLKSKGSLSQSLTTGKSYVVSVNFANGAPDKKETVIAAVSHSNCTSPLSFEVTSAQTQTYTGVFKAVSDSEWISFGFDGSVDRSSVTDENRGKLIYDASAGANSFYVAEETAYDIKVDGDKTEFVSGDTFTLDAAVLNQIDTEGNLSQDFTWVAVNTDRTEEISGIVITADESDSSTATVTIGNVPSGDYIIVAQSADYSMARHYPIKIKGTIENTVDYVASGDKLTNNIILKATDGNRVADRNWSYGNLVNSTYPNFTYEEKSHSPAGDGYYGKAGPSWFLKSKGSLSQSLTTGKSYVVSVNFANGAPDKKETVIAAVSHSNCTSPLSFEVTSAQTQTYTGVFKAVSDSEWISFGFDGSVDRSSVTDENRGKLIYDASAGANSFYVAEESAYDIVVEGPASSVAQGESIKLSASVLNQVDMEGNLNQEFTWIAITEDRTEYVEGITIVSDSEDSSKATVEVADDVAIGNYIIVAQNGAYGMNRQYPITVTNAPAYDVTELTLSVDSMTAVLEALTVETEKAVKVVLAAFTGERLASAIETIVTPEDGVATLKDPLALSGLSAGDKVRVFVWDELLAPFSMKSAWKTPITIE